MSITYIDIIDMPKRAKKMGIKPVVDSDGFPYYFVDLTRTQFEDMKRDPDFMMAVLHTDRLGDSLFETAIKTVDGLAIRVLPLLDDGYKK